jgi:hypothetical protein
MLGCCTKFPLKEPHRLPEKCRGQDASKAASFLYGSKITCSRSKTGSSFNAIPHSEDDFGQLDPK